MTILADRPNTALLVIDVQNGVVGEAYERDAVVANVGALVEKARQERVPVIWVQHSDEGLARGSDEWRIVPELTPGDTEPLIEKNYGDSFEDTNLETVDEAGQLFRAGGPPDGAKLRPECPDGRYIGGRGRAPRGDVPVIEEDVEGRDAGERVIVSRGFDRSRADRSRADQIGVDEIGGERQRRGRVMSKKHFDS